MYPAPLLLVIKIISMKNEAENRYTQTQRRFDLVRKMVDMMLTGLYTPLKSGKL